MRVSDYRRQPGAAVGVAVFVAVISSVTADGVCNATNNPFVRVENDLFNPKYGMTAFSFPFRVFDDDSMQDQVPRSVSVPEFVRVFELVSNTGNNINEGEPSSLFELGMSARQVLDANTPPSPAVLFRNLNQRIKTASDFKEFWRGVMHSSAPERTWKYMNHTSRGCFKRPTLDGVDLPADAGPNVLFRLHNEQLGNPVPPTRFALYCLQNATKGGESMFALNTEVTENIPSRAKTWIEAHGGFSYPRYYLDAENWNSQEHHADCRFWQWRTGANTKEEAKRFFTELGWKEEDISFNENGDMSIQFGNSGFISFNETKVWFNNLQSRVEPTRDGSLMPRELLKYVELAMWKSVRTLPLQPGDLIVLNNLKVMHGRYPFENSAERERKLLVVYAEHEEHRKRDNVTFHNYVDKAESQ